MGVPEYSMTAAVWLRGMFEHEYGVPPSEIHWVQAGEEHPGRKDRVDFEMPAGVTMESRPDTTLNAMIESGEIDAMMSPRMPTCFLQGSPQSEAAVSRTTGKWRWTISKKPACSRSCMCW